MNKLEYGHTTIAYPSTWNELTKRQLFYVSAKWQEWAKLSERPTFLVSEGLFLARVLLGAISLNPFKPIRKILKKLSAIEMHALVTSFDWLLTDISLTKQLLPYVKVRLKRYYGPDDALKNITIDEFAFADTFFMRYTQTKDENQLNIAIACLYRPGKKGSLLLYGDYREAFNNNNVETRIKAMAKLKNYEKQAIYLFYRGCRNKWEQEYPAIFNGTPTQGTDFGWLGIIQSLAGEKFGTVDQVGKRKAYEVFSYVQMITERNEAAKAKAEAERRAYGKY